MAVDPHIEHLDAWIGAGVRQVTPMDQLKDVFGPTYERVAIAAQQAGAKIAGPAYAEYYGMPGETVDVEIGFAIDRNVTVPGCEVRERPGCRAVVATHLGPHDRLAESYTELMPWLEMTEFELSDSMVEFYDSQPDDPPESLVTRLVFPLT